MLIEVEEKPHPLFLRRGDDIIIDAPISLATAVLGGRIEVPTLNGAKTVSVPSGATHGALLRIKGTGIGHLDGGRGDQLVRILLHVPKKPAGEERKIWQKLADVAQDLPAPSRPA